MYRKYLELNNQSQEEKDYLYYKELFEILEKKRVKLGRAKPDSQCIQFYHDIKYSSWEL